MKKIKFRGLAIEDYTGKPITEKKFVYGNVWANEDNSYVIIGEYKDKKGCCYNYKVDPESVAQFVGYDADGKEVYEGDKLCLKDDGNFSAVEMYFKFGDCFCPVGKKFSAFKLKGRGKNENLS